MDLKEVYIESNLEVLSIIDSYYDKRYRNSLLTRLSARFLENEASHFSYKKWIAAAIVERLKIARAAYKFSAKIKSDCLILFIPKVSTYGLNRDFCGIDADIWARIKVPIWVKLRALIRVSVNKMTALALVFAVPLWLAYNLVKKKAQSESHTYKTGIIIVGGGYGFASKHRNSDFIVKNREESKDDVVVIIENQYANLTGFSDTGYSLLDVRDFPAATPKFIADIVIKKFILYWVKSILLSVFSSTILIESNARIMVTYLKWTSIMQVYNLKNIVTFNDFTPQHVIRNILLKQHETNTIYFAYSAAQVNVYARIEELSDCGDVLFSFLHYDYVITWGKTMEQFFNACHTFNTRSVGALWSDFVQQALKDAELEQLKRQYLQNIVVDNPKIIGVFDIGKFLREELQPIHYSSVVRNREVIEFCRMILQLLEDRKNLVVIFKELDLLEKALTENAASDVIDAYQSLFAHERCTRALKVGLDTPQVIAMSHLTVTSYGLTPTIEAICAGKKAIYLDSTNVMEGCFYDRYPMLIAHNYEQFQELVDYWLNDVNDELLNNYLGKYMCPDIDPYLDGKAIDRIRELLA
ncbi:MAG: polysaccharide biosynthesis PFTS motif protein [Acidobacteriota bacterium]